MKKFIILLLYGCITFGFNSCEDGQTSGLYLTDELGYSDSPISSDEKYKDYEENPFIEVNQQAVSTFSIDADGASYANMRRFLHNGQTPPKASVRIEEYINYFPFDYNDPIDGENIALHAEVATCPWNEAHHLLRLGIKGKSISEEMLPNSNYVFLIDVSGSMGSPDKLELLKTGFTTMVDHLNPDDQVAIVTYAGEAGVLLESTPGSEKETIKQAIAALGSGGSTAGTEGIITAYEIAQQHFISDGNNRVILGTDGDFNVGPSSTDELIALIEEKRDYGIYLSILGVGTGNLNDHMMEQVANKGNGNYEYIDNAKQIQKVFVHERSKFYTVAKDCKIQLSFNADKVISYRLIGYENRSLNEEDFDNDKEDAGEIGASQTITALYEMVLKDDVSNASYALFDVRYKKPNEDMSILLSTEVASAPQHIDEASENMRFAAAIGGFGLLMKQSLYGGTLNKQMVLDLGENATSFDPHGYRQEFLDLVDSWNE